MKRYRLELVLAAVLLAVFVGVCQWQAPGGRLAKGDIDRYVAQIERLAPMPEPDKAAFLVNLRAWGESDDGKPVYMVNLMRYYAQLKPWPGVTIQAATPAEANAHYESAVLGMALLGGVQMPVGSDTQGVRSGPAPTTNLVGHAPEVDNWSRVLVVRYPSRRAFFELVSDPEYLKVMPYKFASLQLALIPTDGATVMPDPRLLAGMGGLIILLAVGWLRAARRANTQGASRGRK